MNEKTFEIVSGLAMLVASLILTYIFDKLRRFFRQRRSGTNLTDGGGLDTATSLAETTDRLEAIVTLFNNRVTAEQPREEPATARQVEEASTLIQSDSATSLAETTAQLEAIVTLFNNRVTAEQPREEPATARQVEEASTLIHSDSATSSTATRSHSLQNHMPSREYADSVVLLNPQSHFPLTNHSRGGTGSLD